MDKEKVAGALFILILAAAALYFFGEIRKTTSPWYGATVLEEEVELADWADKNLNKSKIFASDLFACEMLTAVARQLCAIGGAWELADRPNERYQANERVFVTNSSQEAYENLKRFNSEYVLVADRTGFYAYGWKKPQMQVFEDTKYFELVQSKGSARIYKVKE